MAKRGVKAKNHPMMGQGTTTIVSPAHIAHRRATVARGGLSAAEQAMAKRMKLAGSGVHTIRVELGGRYTVAQIEQALM